ncbi:DUF2231 domain-containing protein [Naasia sp. SYSU D00057]|uniref:DUF2231 domain-containing protein n=1 Tax=Naasia sp. SYSU D00057 TaxID=2817380 RepID=UPI001B300512|nr:DUF2231 domain-containing protein [Naasia sp. SYSU D00057]
MDFSVNGLPLHPLLVHSVIALVPLTAIAVVLHVLWPAARRRLGAVTPLLGLALAVATPVTVLAGRDLRAQVGPIPAVDRHAALGETMTFWAVGLLAVSAAAYAWFRWRDRLRLSRSTVVVLTAVLAVVSIGVSIGALAMVVLVGDSGARAVWGT